MKSNSALKKWLMREVHGIEVPRRPPQKASVLHPNKPARNWRYRAWIRTLPCAACGSDRNVEACHTGSDGGGSQKASDYSCVPLCTDCHTMGAGAYHRVGRADFERRNGLDLAALVKRLNRVWFLALREGA